MWASLSCLIVFHTQLTSGRFLLSECLRAHDTELISRVYPFLLGTQWSQTQKRKAFSWSPSTFPQLWLPNRSSMKVVYWHPSGQREGPLASEDSCKGPNRRGRHACPMLPIALRRADVTTEAGRPNSPQSLWWDEVEIIPYHVNASLVHSPWREVVPLWPQSCPFWVFLNFKDCE